MARSTFIPIPVASVEKNKHQLLQSHRHFTDFGDERKKRRVVKNEAMHILSESKGIIK